MNMKQPDYAVYEAKEAGLCSVVGVSDLHIDI